MEYVLYLLKNNKGIIFISAFIGMCSGGLNALLLTLVNERITTMATGDHSGIGYFFLVSFSSIGTGVISQLILIKFSQNLIYKIRTKMCYEMLKLPLRQFEIKGSHRMVATFAGDIITLSHNLLGIPGIFINMAVTAGCLGYLGYLSPMVLLFLLIFIVLAIVSYLIPEKVAIRFLQRNRDAFDQLFQEFNAMNSGNKELRLHYGRRADFFKNILTESIEHVRTTGNAHRVLYTFINNWGNLLYFIFMGVLLFVVPQYQDLDLKTMTGYVLISLYVVGPIDSLIDIIPQLRTANVAFNKIKDIGLDMLGQWTSVPFEDQDAFLQEIAEQPPIQRLQLAGATHTFYREKEETDFTLGPIDLDFEGGGKIIFIIGGNGSGKTTLGKILTGLYLPENGQILVNGKPINEDNVELYRQYFTAIFSDFFIFEQILGIDDDALDERVLGHLRDLHLENKVTIKDGKLSTSNLSTGQRKRLALLTAIMEDRQAYLFDEWAAEQDPEFKNVFYRQILPELREKGKLVFVISHDDRYFDLADYTVKLADGQLET